MAFVSMKDKGNRFFLIYFWRQYFEGSLFYNQPHMTKEIIKIQIYKMENWSFKF